MDLMTEQQDNKKMPIPAQKGKKPGAGCASVPIG
jgi:hypothetical protein